MNSTIDRQNRAPLCESKRRQLPVSRSLWALPLAILLASGCTQAVENSQPAELVPGAPESKSQPIINGYGANPESVGVVRVVMSTGTCSGVLLNNWWVMTAAHCLTEEPVPDWNDIGITMGPRISKVLTQDHVYLEPNGNDIALLLMDWPIEMNGSETGYSRPVRFGEYDSLKDKFLVCYGFGGGGLALQKGYFQVGAVSATQLDLVAGFEHFELGDSGGPCFDVDGKVTSVQSVIFSSSLARQTRGDSIGWWGIFTIASGPPL